MAYLGLTGDFTNNKKSSAHVEGEVGELSESIKAKIDLAITFYELKNYKQAKKIINSLPEKIKISGTVQKLLCCMN